MTLETLKDFFMWTTILHYSILVLWVMMLKFAGTWFRHQQRFWFPVPEEHFMSINYLLYGGYKLMALVTSAIPFIALVILDPSR